jgi:hypothetical protein
LRGARLACVKHAASVHSEPGSNSQVHQHHHCISPKAHSNNTSRAHLKTQTLPLAQFPTTSVSQIVSPQQPPNHQSQNPNNPTPAAHPTQNNQAPKRPSRLKQDPTNNPNRPKAIKIINQIFLELLPENPMQF